MENLIKSNFRKYFCVCFPKWKMSAKTEKQNLRHKYPEWQQCACMCVHQSWKFHFSLGHLLMCERLANSTQYGTIHSERHFVFGNMRTGWRAGRAHAQQIPLAVQIAHKQVHVLCWWYIWLLLLLLLLKRKWCYRSPPFSCILCAWKSILVIILLQVSWGYCSHHNSMFQIGYTRSATEKSDFYHKHSLALALSLYRCVCVSFTFPIASVRTCCFAFRNYFKMKNETPSNSKW